MKYDRSEEFGFKRYTSQDCRIVIREGERRRKTKKVYGRGGRHVTEKVWNVFVDGNLVARDVVKLKDAKAVGEAAARTANPWESTGGGCLVGAAAEGMEFPCDDDFEETTTGEVINIQTTHEGHFELPTRHGGQAKSVKEIMGYPGVKKGSKRQVRKPTKKSNPSMATIMRRALR
jgi:hypothetical protein